MKKYSVRLNKKARKSLTKMPVYEQQRFKQLVIDIATKGPVQPKWPNYSKLGKEEYHCHLSYKWVACWSWKNQSIFVEVYYVGSRENAPY